MNWNYDLHELPTHRSEPVLVAAKDSNRMFMTWYNTQIGQWVNWPPAFEMLCFAKVDHPRPGKTLPVNQQLVDELTPPAPPAPAALPPGIVIEPKVALPPGIGS